MHSNGQAQALVTGGSGFVARRLIERLVRDGYAVRATYRGTRPAAADVVEWVPIENIGPDTVWTEALAGVQLVFHLAGLAHQIRNAQHVTQEHYDQVNALGTETLARCLVARGQPARLVLLSSIGAVCSFSDEPVHAQTAERPDTPYGRSKLLAEQLLRRACADSSIEWCIVRAPIVYGPGAPGNMQRFLRLLERRVPLPLGRATAARSMIYVDNLVDILALCGRAAGAAGQTFLVADEEVVSVAELIELVGRLRERRTLLLPVPAALILFAAALLDRLRGAKGVGGLRRAVLLLFGGLALDTSAVRARLGWRAPHPMREGIERTVCERPARGQPTASGPAG